MSLLAASLIFPSTMAWAGLMDLITMKIRNSLVLFLLVAYAVMAPLAGFGIALVGSSALVALLVLVCAFTFFALGWMGGGDAKLAAAAALWIGADQAFAFAFWTALFGGVLTLALLLFRLRALPVSWRGRAWIERLHARETGVPYGVAIAAAALVVFPATAWMTVLA